MNLRPRQPDDEATLEPVRRFLERRASGDFITADAFLRSCPGASEELRQALRRAELVSHATDAAESDQIVAAVQRLTSEVPEAEESVREATSDIRMTVVETDDDIRSTCLLPSEPKLEDTVDLGDEVVPLRPVHRPPTPILKIFDDNQTSGELSRIRKSPFRIGQREGDCVLPHDSQISTPHAEIYVSQEADGYHWYLQDLGSEQGTFVKAQYARLQPGKRVRVGRHVFRFEEGLETGQPATLVDVTDPLTREAIFLSEGEHWLGRDPTVCPSFLLGDATLDRKHALVYKRKTSQWWIKSLGAHNGVWMEIDQARLQSNCSFLLGEQRFAFLMT